MDRNTSVTTYSRQHLVVNEEINNSGSSEIKQNYTNSNNDDTKITKKEWITVLILCFVNLINYMDRMTVSGKYQCSIIIIILKNISFNV